MLQPTPFLDIADRLGSQSSEQGLLSIAFPPDGTASGMFYVNYTDRRGDTVIARYRLLEGNPRQADPASEQIILQVVQPAANHNGGQLQFGPDGHLYVGMGDGGRAGDPWGNAQNPATLLGKMLRLDVTGTDTYRIPMEKVDRARTDNDISGLVKVIYNRHDGTPLGATIVSKRAGDLIMEWVYALEYGLKVEDIAGSIHVYPSFSRANVKAARAVLKATVGPAYDVPV